MFDSLTDKLTETLKKIRGHARITEENIAEAMAEVRTALLEADVNIKVARTFVKRVTERAVGLEVVGSLTPGQQVIKVVHEELVSLLGTAASGLNLSSGPRPAVILMVGLQGSGKTTTTGKLARMLGRQGHRPYLVPADVYRPAAIEQLKVLGRTLAMPVHDSTTDQDPVEICRAAKIAATEKNCDVMLVDTAGRLHVDEELMAELSRIKTEIRPAEILFVADAMTGQDAVTVAARFNEELDITGVVLTKMDGDARGGAALSIREVTGRPLKFVGVGEALDALEVFHPDRVASRILGMGDVLTLIEKAEAVVDRKKAEKLAKKIGTNAFTLEDFRDQIRQIRKMGSIEQLMGMIPGANRLKHMGKMPAPDEKELDRIEAIINSMTPEERRRYDILNASRRPRIARGSGTTVQDVNRVVKNYADMLKMMKKFRGLGALGGMKAAAPKRRKKKRPKGLRR